MEMNIEKEVQARVEFKMNELLIAIKNRVNINWNAAFQSGNPKYQHYMEAFNQMSAMFKKELEMGLPFDEMAETKRIKKRDNAVEKIMSKFFKKGTRDYYEKEKAVVHIIEESQKW